MKYVSNITDKLTQSSFWKLLATIEKLLLIISSLTVVITLCLVVLGRHVLHYAFLGYTEILVLAAFWMYFIGASYGSCEESHITADILSQFVGEKAKLKLSIFSKCVQVAVGIPLICLSFGMLQYDIKTQQATVDLEIPLLWSQAPIFIGFALMTFYAVIYIVRDIYKLKHFSEIQAELTTTDVK